MSSLGLRGSLDCPNSTLHSSWPPPPPPLPKPCTEGPDSRRGCPHFEWYYSNTTVRHHSCVQDAPARKHMALFLAKAANVKRDTVLRAMSRLQAATPL